MPTTIAVADRDANARSLARNAFAVMKDPDFLAVAGFVVIGLLASLCLTRLWPLADDLATTLAQVVF